MKINHKVIIVICILALPACSTGRERILFATKTNIGIDIDATPPTAELSIARRELVIPPVFEDGKTLPVLATFRHDSRIFTGLRINGGTFFAGGDPAVWASALIASKDDHKLTSEYFGGVIEGKPYKTSLYPEFSHLCVDEEPKFGYEGHDVAPLFFATDTSFGLKVGWSGVTGAAPNRLQFGFNRKEFALAPVHYRKVSNRINNKNKSHLKKVGDKYITKTKSAESTESTENKILPGGTNECRHDTYFVDTVPFLAATIKNTNTNGESNEQVIRQYFATGSAATLLSMDKEVRQAIRQNIGADDYSDGETRREFLAYLNSSKASENRKRMNCTNKWLEDNNVKDKDDNAASFSDFLLQPEFANLRAVALTEIKATCDSPLDTTPSTTADTAPTLQTEG